MQYTMEIHSCGQWLPCREVTSFPALKLAIHEIIDSDGRLRLRSGNRIWLNSQLIPDVLDYERIKLTK